MPAEAVLLAPDASGGEWTVYGVFVLPSMNIGCDVFYSQEIPGAVINCTIRDYAFEQPPVSAECMDADVPWAGENVWIGTTSVAGECRGDAMGVSWALQYKGVDEDGTLVKVLNDGEILRQGDLACLSGEDGLTCWNGATGHGFKLSKSAQLTW